MLRTIPTVLFSPRSPNRRLPGSPSQGRFRARISQVNAGAGSEDACSTHGGDGMAQRRRHSPVYVGIRCVRMTWWWMWCDQGSRPTGQMWTHLKWTSTGTALSERPNRRPKVSRPASGVKRILDPAIGECLRKSTGGLDRLRPIGAAALANRLRRCQYAHPSSSPRLQLLDETSARATGPTSLVLERAKTDHAPWTSAVAYHGGPGLSAPTQVRPAVRTLPTGPKDGRDGHRS